MKLLYQKVYFKSDEWKELLSYIFSISSKVSVSLLSKNVVDPSLKTIKDILVGECVILNTDIHTLSSLFVLINKIQLKYSSRLFLVGFLFQSLDVMYFLQLEQLRNYNNFFDYKKKNILNPMYTVNQFILFELCKFFKLNDSNIELCMYFFSSKSMLSNSDLNYIY